MRTSFAVTLLLVTPLVADTTFDSSDRYAWSGNAGWVNLAGDSVQGVVAGEAYFAGYAWATNIGWIHFGDGSPTNGHTYSNSSASDYGVNHDGSGNLSGYAWSANTGWIHFGWALPADSNRPRFDLQTGAFSGYAWSGNIGWVNLGAGYLTTSSMAGADADIDGIADAWEYLHFGNLGTASASTDQDHDGVPDLAEYAADTDPLNPADQLRIVTHTYASGFAQATLEFTTKPSRLYRMQYSNDLGVTDPWADSPFGTFAPSVGATTTKVFNFPENSKKFFRAIALRPLQP